MHIPSTGITHTQPDQKNSPRGIENVGCILINSRRGHHLIRSSDPACFLHNESSKMIIYYKEERGKTSEENEKKYSE